jgi:hypothetical protein
VTDRVIHKTSPEEAARLDRLATLAEAERDEIVRRAPLYEQVAAEPTFKGEVLRAINGSMRIPLSDLATTAGVDMRTLDKFRCGERELPLAAFERLARRLGFILVKTSEHAPV